VIPDVTFKQGSAMKFTLNTKIYPQGEQITKGPFTINSTDGDFDFRARGRSFQAKFESDTTGVSWRLGTWRADGRQDGLR